MLADKRTKLSKFINKVKDIFAEIKRAETPAVYFKLINKLYKMRLKYDENEKEQDDENVNADDDDDEIVYVPINANQLDIQDKKEQEEIEDESKKTSKKMRDYIDQNLEKYKIIAFNNSKRN